MAGKAGDRVVLDSERVGMPAREGEIVEAVQRGDATRYRIRWSDGRETTVSSSSGSLRIVPGKTQRAQSTRRTQRKR
jgi:hypothetical protein